MQEYSAYFSENELTFIRNQAMLGEKQVKFSTELLEMIHKKEWLRVAMPNYRENNPLSAYEIALLFESLAYADGSLGWSINLGAGANMFLGYLEKNTAKDLEKNKKLWFAGSGACTGKAVETETGYIVSGHWKYASGSLYASHFTANAYLYDTQGKQILDKNKQAVFRSFIFPKDKVEVLDTWHTTGLLASCSNDYKVSNCFVPSSYVFDLTKQSNYLNIPLYKYSFAAFSIANIAVMCTGMTLHFIELFKKEIFAKKPLYSELSLGEEPQVKQLFYDLTQDFYKSRIDFLDTFKKLWQAVVENKTQDQTKLETLLEEKSKAVSDKAYVLVMGLYRYCGMNTVFCTNEISKVVSDFLVAIQHYVISPLSK